MDIFLQKYNQLFGSLEVQDKSTILSSEFLDEKKLSQLVKYSNLIEKWNRSHDLVSQKKSVEIFQNHILDSLLALYVYRLNQEVSNDCYIDIGSGAGLPGIVWHILFNQEIPAILFEPRAKRVSFLKEVRKELNLKNLEIKEQDFSFENLEFKNPLCSIRALKPEKKITSSLFGNASRFSLVWLTTIDASIKEIEANESFSFESILYSYVLDNKVARELRVFRSIF